MQPLPRDTNPEMLSSHDAPKINQEVKIFFTVVAAIGAIKFDRPDGNEALGTTPNAVRNRTKKTPLVVLGAQAMHYSAQKALFWGKSNIPDRKDKLLDF